MKKPRKSTGKRLRFEIFARDGFRCRYCGRQSDEVQLVLDHIEPHSKGGPTVPENLITSCADCNAGKAAKRLAEFLPTDADRLAREQEMREQQRALEVAYRTIEARQAVEFAVRECLIQCFGSDAIGKPSIHVLMAYFNEHGPELLFSWIHKASSVVEIRDAGRYVSGIRRRWKQEQGGAE